MSVYTIRVLDGPSFRCPDSRPILDAAWEQGVTLPFSCRAGGCGHCLARLLSGRVDHGREHMPPEPDEGTGPCARLCQAYPLSDCTIRVA